ncbi:uncharacterized protein F5147DRAFT_775952 [Suillus discolor]|uniref:Uncharacterized protein n=1 Tax=Suillus discolor TaxID=1912936 RepID=A0A9P7F3V4_9AGAM|nr:uncharacterized protein F5147DRAFT_775952 [Suillus discolor]KAG2103405.1 hypothetical protein F5147DRAFT_775952 [Suillus discolor]
MDRIAGDTHKLAPEPIVLLKQFDYELGQAQLDWYHLSFDRKRGIDNWTPQCHGLSEEEKRRVPLTSGIKHRILVDVCNVSLPADGVETEGKNQETLALPGRTDELFEKASPSTDALTQFLSSIKMPSGLLDPTEMNGTRQRETVVGHGQQHGAVGTHFVHASANVL